MKHTLLLLILSYGSARGQVVLFANGHSIKLHYDTIPCIMLMADTSLHMVNRGREQIIGYDSNKIDKNTWSPFSSNGWYITVRTKPILDSVYYSGSWTERGYEVRKIDDEYHTYPELIRYLDTDKKPLKYFVWQSKPTP